MNIVRRAFSAVAYRATLFVGRMIWDAQAVPAGRFLKRVFVGPWKDPK